MKEKTLRLFALCAVVLLGTLAACAPVAAPMSLSDKDNGKQVTLAIGQELTLVLESNVTTGFTWEVTGLNASLLEPIGAPEYKAPQSGSAPVVGAGGTQIFRFKAKASGQAELKLIYHRTFEKDVPPAKTFLITLSIK